MASTSSISGLVSGLDTASLIDQLMSLEARQQTKLKYQVTTETSKVTALQQVNSALATLAEKAAALATASTSGGTWGSLTATSSSTAVTATATGSALPGSLTVSVDTLATTSRATVTSALTAGSTYSLTLADGSSVSYTTDADPSYAELAAQINASSSTTGLQAVVINDGSAGGVLQIRSTATGDASNFSISDGTHTISSRDTATGGVAGVDGRITVNGVTVTGSSNTYANVVDGVTLTATAETTTDATVTLARDASSRSDAIKDLVDSVNNVLTLIGTKTAVSSSSSGTSASTLTGDSTVRQASYALVSAIWPDGGGSLSQYGVELDRYGKYTFDADKFAEAYAADPDATTAAFVGTDGLAARVQGVAEAASDKYDGYITNSVNGHNSTIERLNDRIAEWDDRLALRRTTLEKQYTALETLLSNLNAQSSWLTSTISSMTSSSSE
ncbi:hypothetical protein E8D34_15365 [Nocardioides sp. GY 10113]|uniref:flagellar filament capping protein FliD n=1 Tax=Nocardioides sp. GY 10113 TaxID=2569761 RepID=UPI0010A88DFF|nr:flagellar filament capping protein FliD [Nocardioides sp. GY 10113]TIC83512.1 hypothetical protein E8D34_15365 [Nocardioides sp. GY 10113]